MKKQVVLPILSLLAITLFVGSLVASVFAYPPQYGLIKANKRKHIVRNYLYDDPAALPYPDTMPSGWITFACQSVEGFQYSVAVRDLLPTTAYTVQAVSLATIFVPGAGPVPTSDGSGIVYPLGIINTNGEGEGEVTGLVSLPLIGHTFYPPFAFPPVGGWLYDWEIQVLDSSSNIVLETITADPIDFLIYPAWP